MPFSPSTVFALAPALAPALAIAAIASSSPPSGAPRAGEVIAAGKAPPGWEIGSSGYWCRDYAAASTCFYTSFSRPGVTVIALAVPVTRTPAGGVLTERVTATFVVPLGPGEYASECDIPAEHEELLGVVSPRRHETRVYWTDGAQLFVLTRPYTGEPPCGVDD